MWRSRLHTLPPVGASGDPPFSVPVRDKTGATFSGSSAWLERHSDTVGVGRSNRPRRTSPDGGYRSSLIKLDTGFLEAGQKAFA
jgi:hypothetical protein